MTRRRLLRKGCPLDASGDRLVATDLLIEDGVIKDRQPGGTIALDGVEVIEAEDYVLLPGLINGHTHSTGNLAKGLGEKWTLELQINATNFLYRDRSTDEKYLSALIGALDMLGSGCTACYDLVFEWPAPSIEGLAAVAQAYDDVGLRAFVAPMLASQGLYEAMPGLLDHIPAASLERARATIGPGATGDMLARCADILAAWPSHRDVRPALAPSIPLHCTDALLTGCAGLAERFGCGLHTHLAESKIQAMQSREKFGLSVTARLARLGLLDSRLVAAHAVWVDDSDIALLAAAGTKVVLNPTSNMRLGSGLAPARKLVDAGLPVGLGTDSAICSDSLNMLVAMRAAGLCHGLAGYERSWWLSPREVLALATEGGARVLGRERELGRLEIGYRADIVFVDRCSINLIPLNAPAAQIVRCEEGRGLRHVMIDGEFRWRDGRPVGIDLRHVARRAQDAVARLEGVYRLSQGIMDELAALIDRYCSGLAARSIGVERHLRPN